MNKILQKRIEEAAENHEQCYNVGEEHGYLYMHKGDIKEAVIYGATFALQNQWISVDEVLPKCNKCHLAMYEDGGIIVAKYENETWWWQDGFVVGRNTEGDLMYSSSCKVPSGLITHWMERPQLKGDEE